MTTDDLVRGAFLAYPIGLPWPLRDGFRTPPLPFRQMHQTIKGGPPWTQSDRYTIDAKAEGPASTEMMQGPMMQTLLKDRFKLRVHLEDRDMPVYFLTVAKGGLKLQRSADGNCVTMDPLKGPPAPRKTGSPPARFCQSLVIAGRGGLEGSLSMEALCTYLSRGMDRDLLDHTGLAGLFEVHLELTFADISPGRTSGISPRSDNTGESSLVSDPGNSIPNALRKVGLQIQPGKKTGEFVVIDHVERPSGN